MNIVTDRGTVHISFGYTTDKKHRIVTHAYVTMPDGAEVTASATCSKSDRFSKEAGRKAALEFALKDCDREFRTQIWAGYFARLTTGK